MQFLHCRVTSPQISSPFLLTLVYAKCTRRDRKDLWEDLKRLDQSSLPWCVGGDYNIIVDVVERQGGADPDLHGMNDFGTWIMDCSLIDIGFEGVPLTWKGSGIRQRLDRMLFNQSWLDCFSVNKVVHGVSRSSDHRSLILSTSESAERKMPQFRFQSMWLQHQDCIPSIASHWNLPARHSGLKKFWEKLHRLKQHLS